MATTFDCIVVGGGIAGVTCAEEIAMLDPTKSVLIISASPVVKTVSGYQQLGRAMESFGVEGKDGRLHFSGAGNVRMLSDVVEAVDFDRHVVRTKRETFGYKKLCLCTGGRPKILPGGQNNPNVIGIRDTETVEDFQKHLASATRILIVGNGGIATELVFELEHVDIVWAIRHDAIAATFVDAGAAEFFLPFLAEEKQRIELVSKRPKYTHIDLAGSSTSQLVDQDKHVTGSALGPDWVTELCVSGRAQAKRNVHVEYQCEIEQIINGSSSSNIAESIQLGPQFMHKERWPVYVRLSSGKTVGCDLIVSATGVEPNVALWPLEKAADGGIPVDDQLETCVKDVFAAGDVCTAAWQWASHWMQMRLWTQARQMGAYVARSMLASLQDTRVELDVAFEIFTHCTRFFGCKVVLLGKFNGQGLDNAHVEALVRVTKGSEYVKILLTDGRVQGAILIGETDLEETMENLILNGTDVSRIKDGLLDPSVDIEDYFD